MDELTIEGKTYISSKRAAAITGYAKDYVGQLCREGRVEARLIGRSWYVHEPSLRKHRFDEEGGEEVEAEKPEVIEEVVSEKTSVDATWQEPTYTPEPFITMPGIDEKELVEEPVVTEPSVEETKEENQDWKEWFSSDKPMTPAPAEEIYEKALDEPEEEPKPEAIPLHIIEDIRPEPQILPVVNTKSTYGETRRPAASTAARRDSQLVMKAALIAVMVLFLAIALIGTGVADRVGANGLNGSVFIDFLGGTSYIK